MKSFGSLCFVTNALPHETKFEPKAFKCIFLGYLSNHKAYKAYDLPYY